MCSLIRYSLITIVFFALSDCNNPDGWDCVRTRGDVVSELRPLENFSKIYIYDKLDAELIQANFNAVEVIAGENLMNKITSEIDGVNLRINNDNRCELFRDSDKRALVKIYFDTITNLEVFSSGFVHSIDTIQLDRFLMSKRSNGDLRLTLNCNKVFIYSNEYGDAIFNGKCNDISVKQEGVGLVDFSNCQGKTSYVELSGPGETRLNIMDRVGGVIRGNGRLKVYGSPTERNVRVEDEGELQFIGP